MELNYPTGDVAGLLIPKNALSLRRHHQFNPAPWQLALVFRLMLSRGVLRLLLSAGSCIFCACLCAQAAPSAILRPQAVPQAPQSLVVRDYEFTAATVAPNGAILCVSWVETQDLVYECESSESV